jgi:hypothetical protein
LISCGKFLSFPHPPDNRISLPAFDPEGPRLALEIFRFADVWGVMLEFPAVHLFSGNLKNGPQSARSDSS